MCHRCGHKGEADAPLGTRCPKDQTALIPEEDHKKAPKDTILGRVIGGKYPVVGIIGSGGMGSVYRAVQEPVGREVALKVIRNFGDEGNEAISETLRQRFFREAKVVAKLANPSAVTLYDYGAEDDGVLYMVLELVKGRRLSDAIRAEGIIAPARAVSIAYQVLNALTEAHGLGLVHRDLKPDNIMLVRGPWGEEQAKVLDFGIAKVKTKEKENTLETGTGLLLGTPLYMPPEQAMARGAEPRSDLYSLGVVLYEMLVGAPPFTASTVFEVLLAHREKPVPTFPPEYNVPPALEAAVGKAMAKEPEERFTDAAEMAQALLESIPPEDTPTATGGGPGRSMTPAVMRTPLPGVVRNSGPGILNAPTMPPGPRTPVPSGIRKSGQIDPTGTVTPRTPVPLKQSGPGIVPLTTPVSGGEETAGTVLRATPRPLRQSQGGLKPLSQPPQRVEPTAPAPTTEDLPAPEIPGDDMAAAGLKRGPGAAVYGLIGLLVVGGGGGAAWWYLKGRTADAVVIPDPIAATDPKPDKPVPDPETPPDKPAVPDKPVVPVPDKPEVAEAGPDAATPEPVVEAPKDVPPKDVPKDPQVVVKQPKQPVTPKQPKQPKPTPKQPVNEHGYTVPVF